MQKPYATSAAAIAHTANTPIDSSGHRDVWIGADNLVGGVVCTVYIMIGNTWKALYDEQATPALVTLTATRPARNLIGNAIYGIAKADGGADVCTIWYTLGAPN